MNNHCRFQFFTFILIVLIISANAQASDKILNNTSQQIIINKISRLLVQNYIDETVSKKCADYLEEQQKNGRYEAITHPRRFAKQLNQDLMKIHNDRHIRLQFIPPEGREIELQNPELFFLLRTYERRKENFGLREIKIFSGNIGYLDLRLFEPLEMAREKALQVMLFLEDVDALIIDLRDNNGGNPAMVQFLCSWFFDKPVHLNNIYWRRGNYTEEFWTIENIGVKKKPNLPLFILTGSKTFSAGEEFAYDMQAQKRATLIGEKTAGGANPGYTFSISDQFSLFIPTGRSGNPVTGANWEGIGVKPDVSVKGSSILDVALEKARQAGRIYRQKEDDLMVSSYLNLANILKQASVLFDSTRQDSAESTIMSALDSQIRVGNLGEWTINDLGYRYLSDNHLSLALTLFKYNTSRFPDSANAWDSLGEGFYRMRNWALGIEAYEKSLMIDPRNQNAKSMLEKIRNEMQRN